MERFPSVLTLYTQMGSENDAESWTGPFGFAQGRLSGGRGFAAIQVLAVFAATDGRALEVLPFFASERSQWAGRPRHQRDGA